MSEKELLNEIFGKRWKGKYRIQWCDLCDTAIIVCPACNLGSCSGGGCDHCHEDFREFSTYATTVQHYLTPEERLAYEKGHRLKKLIQESIEHDEKEIDWDRMKKEGQLSRYDEHVFKFHSPLV